MAVPCESETDVGRETTIRMAKNSNNHAVLMLEKELNNKTKSLDRSQELIFKENLYYKLLS